MSKELLLYRMRRISVNPGHPLFPYAEDITRLANNLANATRFRQRQVMTAVKKDKQDWTPNEQEILNELNSCMPIIPKPYQFVPSAKKFRLSYGFLEELFKASANPDYYAEKLPRQTAQGVIKQCCRDMKAYFASVKEYKKNPQSFTSAPELPGYKRKGGHCTCYISNQDAVIHETDDHMWQLKLPLTRIRLEIGPAIPDARLKEIKLTPINGVYEFNLVFSVKKTVPEKKQPTRIAAVDLGVENLLAVTNNCGLPCLLYKGGAIKAANQFYNKLIAKLVSEQTLATGKKFVPTPESQRITRARNNYMNDFMHKAARSLVTWLTDNSFDTLVVGVNKMWKQDVELGKVNNQTFVQIPFSNLRWILSYLCEENGIAYIEREESYTSKASFLDNDPIPDYGNKPDQLQFSGHRRPTRYKGICKPNGFRGLYVSSSGKIINSDLNGSANILRKEFPVAFSAGTAPDFDAVMVIRHPDYENSAALKERQIARNKGKSISRAKEKRLRRKIA